MKVKEIYKQYNNMLGILNSRQNLIQNIKNINFTKQANEGGCGVIGIIGTEQLSGKFITRSCEQMHNRGNGKGGGIAAVGLFNENLKQYYAIHIAFLDESIIHEVEQIFIEKPFNIYHFEKLSGIKNYTKIGLEIKPPTVHRYFVLPKKEELSKFQTQWNINDTNLASDELVYQNSFKLNKKYYAFCSSPKAFVLSHAKDLMILKAVGYAEQVAKYYELEQTKAHVWIGHQRYPTRGRIWHPGGAHPFAGLHEALVHNGDFANYHSICEYLKQKGVVPLFITDTELAVLLFDLYARVYNYPLEYIIEALAPTPQGDFERLSKTKQRIYRAIQASHIHGSPDGPWFFIITRLNPKNHMPQLIGITDVSMLRPQVFAVQESIDKSFGAIASEKQAIDAFFEELSQEYSDILPAADRYWNARGGSYTDGGAFTYTLIKKDNKLKLEITNKFNEKITTSISPTPQNKNIVYQKSFESIKIRSDILRETTHHKAIDIEPSSTNYDLPTIKTLTNHISQKENLNWCELCNDEKTKNLATILINLLSNTNNFQEILEKYINQQTKFNINTQIQVLTYLHNKHWNCANKKRAWLKSTIQNLLNYIFDNCPHISSKLSSESPLTRITGYDDWISILESYHNRTKDQTLVIDAQGFNPEGQHAVNRVIVKGYEKGFRKFIAYKCHGDRFIGCGLGPNSNLTRIDVYGSSGDYLGSGIDGAHIYVHGNAQDQVGQILKSGMLVIYGDVGQTFLYGAKGGLALVKGNAAGRALINAVGKIRAIINGTALDYCAESFMAGKEIGDGFVIINGLRFEDNGTIIGLEHKYPGNNLFSLASGGACYINDPYKTVSNSQLNGAEFIPFKLKDWNLILEYLLLNEKIFGISIRKDLLLIDGLLRWPTEVFRKVVPSHKTSLLDWSSLTH